jgi:hypothetical protein
MHTTDPREDLPEPEQCKYCRRKSAEGMEVCEDHTQEHLDLEARQEEAMQRLADQAQELGMGY